MNARVRLVALVVLLGWMFPMSRGLAATRQRWDRRPGVILYHLKYNASPSERTAFSQLLGRHPLAAAASVHAAKSHQALVFPQSSGDEENMAEEMMASGAVDFAAPDYLMPAAAVPNDPQFTSQWFHQTVNSPGAWAYATGSSVLVAVCDTGIDATHPDLLPNLHLPGFNIVDGNSDTSPVTPHGTEVAGILGAVGNNGIGVTGINWGVQILPVRITDNADSSAWCSSMASGIEWAADQGAKVINLSYDTTGCAAVLEIASSYARSEGALVFVAAGNDAEDVSTVYPSSPSFVLVGGTDQSDQPAAFTNYGSAISLAAPGVSMMTTQPGGYGAVSGTSFSSPLVAGVAALIYSLNLSWTPTIVENLILATAKPLSTNLLGYGRVDAGAALAAAQNCLSGNCATPIPINNPPASQQTTNAAAASVSSVRAYPNPWRVDKDQGLPMIIDRLAPGAEVKIFTISAREIRRLSADSTGAASWDLSNDSGERVASGIYLFLTKDAQGQSAHGKLAVIR